MMQAIEPTKTTEKSNFRTLILGGLLPVIIFTVIEEYFGIQWGLIVSIIYATAEITFEKIKFKTVSNLTWFGNLSIIGLGFVSYLFQDGFWFKMQPAIMETTFAIILIFSNLKKRPLLVMLAEEHGMFQKIENRDLQIKFRNFFEKLNLRLSLFLLMNAGATTLAALYCSTRIWALIKGVGFTFGMLLYLILEIFWFRKKLQLNRQL